MVYVALVAALCTLAALVIGHRRGYADGYEIGRLTGHIEGIKEAERMVREARREVEGMFTR